MTEKKTDFKKNLSEDLERLLKDAWNKVVEYASIGAEEATRMSATAKVRVDVETLRFKRGKLLKTLGERYYNSCSGNPDLGVSGTKEVIRQIKGLEQEISALEKSMAEIRRKKEKEQKEAKAKESQPARETPPREPRRASSAGKTVSKKRTSPKEDA